MPNTTDATGNTGSKSKSVLGSEHTMSNTTIVFKIKQHAPEKFKER